MPDLMYHRQALDQPLLTGLKKIHKIVFYILYFVFCKRIHGRWTDSHDVQLSNPTPFLYFARVSIGLGKIHKVCSYHSHKQRGDQNVACQSSAGAR